MSAKVSRRPAGLQVLVRQFGPEFGRGYHAARLSMFDAMGKHFSLLIDRYGTQAANEYFSAKLSLAECDALHVVRQQREMADLAAAHETRVAELLAEHAATLAERDAYVEDFADGVVAKVQSLLEAHAPPKPRTWRERIAAAFDALFNR